MLVGDHLSLDVARLVQVTLHEALTAAECGDGLAGRRLEQFGDLLEGAGHLHAATTAAERGLDGHRNAVLRGERDDFAGVLDRVGRAGNQRGICAGGDVACGHFVAEVADGLRAGSDPDEPGVDDGLGKIGVLREEPVTGVDGVGAGLGRGVEDLAEVEIGLGGGLPAQGERFVGKSHVGCVGIGFGVDGHAAQTRILGRPDHPDRDLAAVGDEDLGDGLTGHGAPPEQCYL